MTLDKHLQRWWEQRTDDQRTALRDAAEQRRMDASTVRLLLGTGCPVGPIGTKWESQPEYGWSWPESVRTFVVAQADGT